VNGVPRGFPVPIWRGSRVRHPGGPDGIDAGRPAVLGGKSWSSGVRHPGPPFSKGEDEKKRIFRRCLSVCSSGSCSSRPGRSQRILARYSPNGHNGATALEPEFSQESRKNEGHRSPLLRDLRRGDVIAPWKFASWSPLQEHKHNPPFPKEREKERFTDFRKEGILI